MCRGQGLVDLDVICEGKVGVSTTFLLSPEGCFPSPFSVNCFGLGDVEVGDFVAIPIKDAVLNVGDLYVCLSVEAGEVLHCEFCLCEWQ